MGVLESNFLNYHGTHIIHKGLDIPWHRQSLLCNKVIFQTLYVIFFLSFNKRCTLLQFQGKVNPRCILLYPEVADFAFSHRIRREQGLDYRTIRINTLFSSLNYSDTMGRRKGFFRDTSRIACNVQQIRRGRFILLMKMHPNKRFQRILILWQVIPFSNLTPAIDVGCRAIELTAVFLKKLFQFRIRVTQTIHHVESGVNNRKQAIANYRFIDFPGRIIGLRHSFNLGCLCQRIKQFPYFTLTSFIRCIFRILHSHKVQILCI